MKPAVSTATLRDYLRVLFRQKAVFFICVAVVTGMFAVGLLFKTPTYTATVKLLITAEKQVEAPYYRDIYYSQNVQPALTQSEVVRSTPVLYRAVEAVGLWQRSLDYEKNFCARIKVHYILRAAAAQQKRLTVFNEEQKKIYFYRMAIENLTHNIRVDPVRDTNMFTISVRDHSPVGAAILANVISRSYVIFDLEQQLAELQLKYGEKHLAVIQMKDNILKMAKSLNGEPLADVEAIGPASVKIIEQAQVPIRPDGFPRPAAGALAFLMSVFMGITLSFACEYADQTFKSPREVEEFLDLPCLGFIPLRDKGKWLEILNERILQLVRERGLKTLLFAAVTGKESARVVRALSGPLADRSGLRVLAVDADPQGGDALTPGRAAASDSPAAAKTFIDPASAEGALQEARSKYDLILIAAPGMSRHESVRLAGISDGIVLVVSEGRTRKQVVAAQVERLKEKKTPILGAVLNDRVFSIPGIIYNRV